MNLNHLITANQKNFQTIGVCLSASSEGRLYTYKAPIDMVLVPGDTVLIAKDVTPKEGVSKYRAALVGEVHEYPQIDYTSNINYTWIVDKVDDVGYLEQIEMEQEQAQQLAHMEVASKKKEFMQFVEETSPGMLEFFDKPKALYVVLPCVVEKDETLHDEIQRAVNPVAPKERVRRPIGDEVPVFWAVYRNEEDGTQTWIEDYKSEERAKREAKELSDV